LGARQLAGDMAGTGWSDMRRYIFSAECARASAPGLAPMGLRMVGPASCAMAAPEQKALHLPRISPARIYWCQGYSEPGSGIGPGLLQLRADSDGDDYVLNGSKIWTTHAHWANRMFCLVRTRFEGKPQAGITFPAAGHEDRRGSACARSSPWPGSMRSTKSSSTMSASPNPAVWARENEGWTVAKYLLEFERGRGIAPGSRCRYRGSGPWPRRRRRSDVGRLIDNVDFRRRLAGLEIDVEAIDMTERMVITALPGGQARSRLLHAQDPGHRGHAAPGRTRPSMSAAHYGARRPAPKRVSRDRTRRRFGPDHSLVAMARYLNNRAVSIYGAPTRSSATHGEAGAGVVGQSSSPLREKGFFDVFARYPCAAPAVSTGGQARSAAAYVRWRASRTSMSKSASKKSAWR